MKAIIVGGGIGGLATALMLRARGIGCELFEQSDTIRELGVGINTLPHAIRELAGLGLLQKLDDVAIRTDVLYYLNRHGQEVWRESRGIDAGHDVPQFSIHRGRLQSVIHRAVGERLGQDAIHTGCRLGAFTQDEGGVTAYFFDRAGQHTRTVRGDILVGADGIHSRVRETLFPDEGPPCWNGLMLWRGARDWPVFLTGRSMIVAGGLHAKVVVYPIAEGSSPASRLTNWAVLVKVSDGNASPPRREDWSRPGKREELMPHIARFSVPYVDVPNLISATPEFYEYRPATAIPCRIGPVGASRCSATPRTQCIRWVRMARRKPFSMRAAWQIRWLVPSIRARRLWRTSRSDCRWRRRSCAPTGATARKA